jgi:hypothetical protein
MLDESRWDEVLGRLHGEVYRGVERISTAAILIALGVGLDLRERWGPEVLVLSLSAATKLPRPELALFRKGLSSLLPPRTFSPPLHTQPRGGAFLL